MTEFPRATRYLSASYDAEFDIHRFNRYGIEWAVEPACMAVLEGLLMEKTPDIKGWWGEYVGPYVVSGVKVGRPHLAATVDADGRPFHGVGETPVAFAVVKIGPYPGEGRMVWDHEEQWWVPDGDDWLTGQLGDVAHILDLGHGHAPFIEAIVTHLAPEIHRHLM